MIAFAKSHVRMLSSVAILGSIVCGAYLPLWRAWPDAVPSALRGLFVFVSMPWSWATLTLIDPLLWGMSMKANVVVPEAIIAIGFGINLALITAVVGATLHRRSHGGVPA